MEGTTGVLEKPAIDIQSIKPKEQHPTPILAPIENEATVLDKEKKTSSDDLQKTFDKISEDKELLRLQKRKDISELIKSFDGITEIDDTMLRWLSGVLLRSKDAGHAVTAWREIVHRKGRNESDFTPEQLHILQLPESNIRSLYSSAKYYLENVTESELRNRIYGDGSQLNMHVFNDKYQLRQTEKEGRSLDSVRLLGIQISIPPEDIEELRKEYIPGLHCPVIDKIKNKRIAKINGFPESKMSLTIHDIFDHFWSFDLLQKNGTLERYQPFLQKVGNPQATDIFKREGELIASSVYQWRSAKNSEKYFTQMFSTHNIQSILEKSLEKSPGNENIQRSIGILSSLDPDGEEARILTSMYSGVLIELMEQRRKHGFIRELVLDESSGKLSQSGRNFPLLDPEYASLLVEINHLLSNPTIQANQSLFKSSALVENYLVELATKQTEDPLVVKLENIEEFDPQNSSLSEDQLLWLSNNLGFAATKGLLCD